VGCEINTRSSISRSSLGGGGGRQIGHGTLGAEKKNAIRGPLSLNAQELSTVVCEIQDPASRSTAWHDGRKMITK